MHLLQEKLELAGQLSRIHNVLKRQALHMQSPAPFLITAKLVKTTCLLKLP
jgi:hypothetical protein